MSIPIKSETGPAPKERHLLRLAGSPGMPLAVTAKKPAADVCQTAGAEDLKRARVLLG